MIVVDVITVLNSIILKYCIVTQTTHSITGEVDNAISFYKRMAGTDTDAEIHIGQAVITDFHVGTIHPNAAFGLGVPVGARPCAGVGNGFC